MRKVLGLLLGVVLALTACDGPTTPKPLDSPPMFSFTGADAAAAAAGPVVYAATSSHIAVISTVTNTIIGYLPQPPMFTLHAGGLAVTPNGERLYAGNYRDFPGTVEIFDVFDGTHTATVGVGPAPIVIEISPDGSLSYVGNDYRGSVSVIETSTNTVVATIGDDPDTGNPLIWRPEGIAFTPNGRSAYVTTFAYNGLVTEVDVATHTVRDRIQLGPSTNPIGVAVGPDGQYAYVARSCCESPAKISVLHVGTNALVKNITVGTGASGPRQIAITPDGRFAYVTLQWNDAVSVIGTATNEEVATIDVGDNPVGITITPDGALAYVGSYLSRDVRAIDIATNTVLATIGMYRSPGDIAVALLPASRRIELLRQAVQDYANAGAVPSVTANHASWMLEEAIGKLAEGDVSAAQGKLLGFAGIALGWMTNPNTELSEQEVQIMIDAARSITRQLNS